MERKDKFLISTTDLAAGSVTFTLGSGERIKVAMGDLSPEVLRHATLHGLKQKIADSAAGFSKGNDYGGAFDAMSATLEAILAGNWNRKKEGGTGIAALAQAVATVKGIAYDAALAAVSAMDEDQRKQISRHPKIELAIAEARAAALRERAETETDLDELLGM